MVPASSDVRAASLPASVFKSVDLPTLGLPTIATSKPVRMRSATLVLFDSSFKSLFTLYKISKTSYETSVGTSSSAKSIVTSIKAIALIIIDLHS